MTSLVVQTSFLGDIVLTTPLIAELAKRGAVDVITTPEGAGVLSNHPAIRNIMVYDRRDADKGIAGFARTVGRIRHAGLYGSLDSTRAPSLNEFYETAYLAQGSYRSALLVVSAGVKNRIGFNTSEGRKLYTEQVEYRFDRHHAERLWYLSMSDCADPPTREQVRPRLYPSADDDRTVEALMSEKLVNPGRPFVALAPGSVWGTKRWPFYPELAVKLVDQFNIVVVGGSADAEAGDVIVAQLPEGCGANAAGHVGILGSAAIIGRAEALVTNDSAPEHLGSAMDTPTIVIFGPTSPAFGFGPLALGSQIAGVDGLDCRPCDHHGPHICPLGHWRCMREVSSDYVFGLITQSLQERAQA
ncbi:MAG TPA: glycosyltransferase family 9 protein [Gemmatimonadaceae bacterium]|nr:glycosyltransferase family 9 protein [Gemmatimonadaceae bacterium]